MRHQLARLLSQLGRADIVFGQRPGRWRSEGVTPSGESGISLFRHRELIHHRIRVSGLLRVLNASWTVPSIRSCLQPIRVTSADVIVNFNYEYLFLRRLFPDLPIITIINDDFVSRALPGCRPSLAYAQQRTCEQSDVVLTPSVVLQQQLAPYCEPELFLPWSDGTECVPVVPVGRRILLYWGFVDWRVDLNWLLQLSRMLEQAEPSIEIWIVGPKSPSTESHPVFHGRKNVFSYPSAELSQLPIGEVIGGLIPFKSGVEGCDAIVLPNKALQLLAYGLPLLITGMPYFPAEPFVFRLDRGDPITEIRGAREQNESLQGEIRSFVSKHTPSARLEQFAAIVERARVRRDRALS